MIKATYKNLFSIVHRMQSVASGWILSIRELFFSPFSVPDLRFSVYKLLFSIFYRKCCIFTCVFGIQIIKSVF